VKFSRNLSGVWSISSESAVNRFVHRDASRAMGAAASFLSVVPDAQLVHVTSIPDEGFVVIVGAGSLNRFLGNTWLTCSIHERNEVSPLTN
jgi:hypothetical protein